MIVRISRGTFDPIHASDVEARLRKAGETLIPAIKKLAGLVGYYAAIDGASGTMINVSLWKSLDDAKQMDGLAEMQALAKEFIEAGVKFERPIINYDPVWSI